MSRRLLAAAFGAGALSAVAAWALWPSAPEPERSAAALMDVLMWGREPIGGPFALVDHTGHPRTDEDFRGKLLLIYFGFTACSDTCPIDLQAIAAAVDRLGPEGGAVQPLFITVNPELDTPEQLRGYVGLFHPRLIGLTGKPREVRAVAQAYKVYARKSEPAKRADPNYDHSGVIYVVDAAGHYVGYLPSGTSADRIVQVLRPQLAALTRS